MPIIPMNQVIKVHRSGNGALDQRGYPVKNQVITHMCRIDEGSFVVKYQNGGRVSSENVVASAKVLLDKLVDVRYDDEIEYENELRLKIMRKPKEIRVKRSINGKPILTEVFL